jgi:hypothetical protein
MADKSTFTPEEWSQLQDSVMMSGMAVTAAEPSGVIDAVKEAFAMGGALGRVRNDATADPLVKAVVEDLASSEGRKDMREELRARLSGKKPPEIKAEAIAALASAGALLDAKAPEDAPAFKAWLREVAQHVAEAGKEGGFLGFGGVRVSDAEKATLAEVSSALRLTA